MDVFNLGAKIMIGGGLDAALEGRRKILIVSDRFLAESGKVSYVTDLLAKTGAQHQIFSDVGADPDVSTVTAGVGQFLEFLPDAVVAFGGGSAIDAAKAILYFALRQQPGHDAADVQHGGLPIGERGERLVLGSKSTNRTRHPSSANLSSYACYFKQLVLQKCPSATKEALIKCACGALRVFSTTTRRNFLK